MADDLTMAQWITSLGCAAFSLVVGAAVKFIDVKHFERITIDLETVSDTDNAITRGVKMLGDKFEEGKGKVAEKLRDKAGGKRASAF